MSVEVSYLTLTDDNSPYLDWEGKLDTTARAAIRTRINRLRLGNFGDCRTIRGGILGLYELRIHLGPGYRVYFGKRKDSVVIILCGGDKGSQERDINKAKKLWQLYIDTTRGM